MQAHQVTQFDKAIEAARRIEHSFIATASNGSSSPLRSDSSSSSTVFNGVSQRNALFSSSRRFGSKNKQSSCWICGSNQHKAHECPQRSAAPKKKSPEVCRNFNKFLLENSKNVTSFGHLLSLLGRNFHYLLTVVAQFLLSVACQSLETPVTVSVADANSQLNAVALWKFPYSGVMVEKQPFRCL